MRGPLPACLHKVALRRRALTYAVHAAAKPKQLLFSIRGSQRPKTQGRCLGEGTYARASSEGAFYLEPSHMPAVRCSDRSHD